MRQMEGQRLRFNSDKSKHTLNTTTLPPWESHLATKLRASKADSRRH